VRSLKRARLDVVGVIYYVWGPIVGRAVAAQAVTVARCESGLRPDAYNPSGATGVFQIIGGPFHVWENVRLALRMYQGRGWQPWVASAYCWS
jgi:hypothetical protein